MFRFLWLKRLVRRHTRPIPIRKADRWSKRLSTAYMILAWNALGFIGWRIYQGKGDLHKQLGIEKTPEMELSSAQRFALQFGMEKAKIKRISGFTDAGTTDFDLEEVKQQLRDKEAANSINK